ITDHDVVTIDLPNRTAAKMELGLAVPRLSWACGITFDTKRLRLLVASFGGGGLLYAYTPKDGKWSVLTDLKGSGPHALTYHPREDSVFGLRTDYEGDSGGIPVLLRYNDRGALVNRTKLGEPMFPGLISHEPLGAHLQLVAAGDYVVAITTSGMHPG